MNSDTSLVKSMKINTSKPPEISSISQVPSSISIIWVKDETIPMYLGHPVWSYFTPIIKPLSKRTEERIGMASFIIGKWDFEIDKEEWQ